MALTSPALLQHVVAAMNNIAPLAMADTKWDNVGTLLESPAPLASTAEQLADKTVFLTIDLTLETLKEAITANAGVIVAYHPPIFSGLKRLNLTDVKQRIVLECVQHGISIYSPHTSADAAQGGINDLLISACFGNQGMGAAIAPIQAVARDGKPPKPGMDCSTGYGRVGSLAEGATGYTLTELLKNLKAEFSVPTLRVALPDNFDRENQKLKSFAVCAGSGSSVLRLVKESCEVFVTGEMSHHDVLAATAAGRVVILAEHTNTERFWLSKVLKGALEQEFENTSVRHQVIVSQKDADPLVVM